MCVEQLRHIAWILSDSKLINRKAISKQLEKLAMRVLVYIFYYQVCRCINQFLVVFRLRHFCFNIQVLLFHFRGVCWTKKWKFIKARYIGWLGIQQILSPKYPFQFVDLRAPLWYIKRKVHGFHPNIFSYFFSIFRN